MSDAGKGPGGVPDPMQFWRDLYQQGEASWGKVLEQTMSTESYAALMGQTLEAYVSFQQALRDSMNRYLETMNLPSRDDFTRLAAQVVALENKIEALDEKLDGLQDGLGGRDGKLDALRASLEAQAAQLGELRASLNGRAEQLGQLRASLEARDSKLEAVLARLEATARGSTRAGEGRAGSGPAGQAQR